MPLCSYVVIPEPDSVTPVAASLAALPGCGVVRAKNRDVLLLVTETASPEEESALRESLDRLTGVLALVLTFGDLDADPAEHALPGGPVKQSDAENAPPRGTVMRGGADHPPSRASPSRRDAPPLPPAPGVGS